MSGVGAAEWVARTAVDHAVFERWPEYRVYLVATDHADPTALAATARDLLADAHRSVRSGEAGAVDEHTALWHAAYLAFGVKPRVARPSSDALVRRAASEGGLPSIGVLVDLYNALSIIHRVPVGGEDLDRYDGSARLVLATGAEEFHTTRDGEKVVDRAEPGEPIWVDDTGVTCRRWNWRQTHRTAIGPSTTRVGFIIDSLDAPDHVGAHAVAEALTALLPGSATRVISDASR